jgi:hypothetical protein
MAIADFAIADDPPIASGEPAEEAAQNKQTARPDLTPEAQQAADELKSTLSEKSEARAMLDQILEGSRLGPGEGWFRFAVSQTRFGWDYVRKAYDRDGNSRVKPAEFTGSKRDFRRMDRDGDRRLTADDFDWSEHSLTRTPGFLMFFRADRDANGKVTREEFNNLFDSLDSGAHGFLSLDDLRDEFQPNENAERQRQKRPDAPSPSTLVIALRDQEIGSLQPGPQLNESAPDFTLTSLEGEQVTLSEEIGDKPVVLVFGNFTCGPFRSHSGNLEKLYEQYKDRAKFFLIYVREAHPKDGWWMISNQRIGIDVPQPKSDAARRQVAQTCREHLKLDIPFLVDSVDDAVGARYSGMPNRLYLIDREGKIAFKNGRGPFGFHPRQLEQNLLLLLNQTSD